MEATTRSDSMIWPDHLLSLDEWDALPEDASRHVEILDGALQMSPRPGSAHQYAIAALTAQLNAAFSSIGLVAVPEVELVLFESPPTVRVPDVVVMTRRFLRTRPSRIGPADAVLVVEVTSPGSRRIDRIAKLADYAEAAIRHYWILDIEPVPWLSTFVLDSGGYRPEHVAATGRVHIDAPLALDVELDQLVL